MAGYIKKEEEEPDKQITKKEEEEPDEQIDWAWFAAVVKLYEKTKAPASWKEAVQGLDVLKVNTEGKLDEHGDPLDVHGPFGLIFILEQKKLEWERNKYLESLGLDDGYMDAALVIHAYSLANPKVFRPINEIFSTGKRNDTEAEEVKASMIYLKMVDISCQKLPSSFTYNPGPSDDSILYRGVKVVYPDFGTRYTKGVLLMWYVFKSVTDRKDLMNNPEFCGNHGPRTIYIIHGAAGLVKYIRHFSQFNEDERELLLLPLVTFEVMESTKQCSGQSGDPWTTADIVHLRLLPDKIVRSPDLAAAMAAAALKPNESRSWLELGYFGGVHGEMPCHQSSTSTGLGYM